MSIPPAPALLSVFTVDDAIVFRLVIIVVLGIVGIVLLVVFEMKCVKNRNVYFSQYLCSAMAALIEALIAPFNSRLWQLLRRSLRSSTATLSSAIFMRPGCPFPT